LRRGEVLVSDRETVYVLEEMLSSFRDRHGDCESGEEREDRRCGGDEFGLGISRIPVIGGMEDLHARCRG
jgi:hypothetical protein